MKIVLLVHPSFLDSRSMTRFAGMIEEGMTARGHDVEVWSASAVVHRLPANPGLRKWLGYVDQYLIFSARLLPRVARQSDDTLFVVTDQALGPWVPLIAKRPHVVHVHDFMALRSALGEFAQNPTAWTGRFYQRIIRWGFRRGHNFVSVSESTRSDLHRFLRRSARLSVVVHNGLNYPYRSLRRTECTAILGDAGCCLPESGFLLHVGGNDWYKNRGGVLAIYKAYVEHAQSPLPLWMVGAPPTAMMEALAEQIRPKGQITFLVGITGEQLCAAYSSARLLVFPSFAEGFGWPIAEAMACGCLVLATEKAPMTEVGGDAAFYLPPPPDHQSSGWAELAARNIDEILTLPVEERQIRRERGFIQASKFSPERALSAYERIYADVLETTEAG